MKHPSETSSEADPRRERRDGPERTDGREGRGKRAAWGVAIAAGWVLVLFGLMCFGAHLWVRRTFGQITVDQLLTNLPGGEEAGLFGAGGLFGGGLVGGDGLFGGTGLFGGDGLLGSAALFIVVLPLVVTAAFFFLVEMSRRALHSAELLRGGASWAVRGTAMALAVAVPLLGGGLFAATIGADDYVRSVATTQNLADYYVHPTVDNPRSMPDGSANPGSADPGSAHANDASSDTANNAAPRNLIVVYLESVEDDLADDSLFASNMLAPVQEATEGWGSIPNLTQYAGGGWTMAGLVATQCGIPLRTAQSHSDRDTLNYELEGPTYLEGATCLSDVLAGEGYRNVFLGGADATFANKGAFLETHGYDEVKDLRHWRMRGETEVRSDWGLSDGRLMERAKEEATRLHESGEPFHLSVLTLDTHESVYRHPYCRAVQTFPGAPVEGVDHEAAMRTSDMTDITRCSMEQVAGFIEHLESEGILDDTTVVVMGDHLKMEAPWAAFYPELDGREGRTIFNRIWVPGGAGKAAGAAGDAEIARDRGSVSVLESARDIDQLSIYATLLDLVGVSAREHRAGVGVSALAVEQEIGPGSILELTDAEYSELIGSRSSGFYREMWGEAPASSDP